MEMLTLADVPFSKEGQEIGQLLRRKAPDEEIAPVIQSIEAQASGHGLDPYVTCTDVFMTAVCWVGSKSLSHVLACIDRTKARLLELSNASEASRIQVVTAVMSYWHAHPGVALSIIEKLLNYSIITPFAVINWALQGHGSASSSSVGEALGKAHVFEIVSNTVAKVTNRVRQLYASDEADHEAREKEAQAMKDMLRNMNDMLMSWATGSKDQMMETGDGSSDREAMIQRWAQRWLRVFQRKAALEETFLLEAAKGKDKMVVENGAGDH
jgi:nuclear cap-binding protein subunit 1